MSTTSIRPAAATEDRTGPGCLVLLRHGRTVWNATGRFQGRADPPLDRLGLDQATQAATELARSRPDEILSSDLQRAAQTAGLVAATCHASLTFDPALREVDLGAWEGLSPAAAAAAFPHEYAAWTAGEDVRRGGGETEREAGIRALVALAPALARCHAGRTIVVVSHGLVLRSVLRGLALRDDFAAPVPAPHLGNGQWIALRTRPT